MRVAILFHIICALNSVLGMSIRIQGSFDLGPEWDPTHMISEESPLRGKHGIEKSTLWKIPEMNKIGNEIDKIIQGIKNSLKIGHTYEVVTPKLDRKRKVKASKKKHKRKVTSKNGSRLKSKGIESTNHKNNSESKKDFNTKLSKKKYKDIFVEKAQKVKDVPELNDFMLHINKQALKILQNMKHKVDSKNVVLRQKIKTLKKAYKQQFVYFLNETRHRVIKTNSEAQKVIRNAIKKSNRILEKLVNQVSDTNNKDVLRKELDRQRAIEDTHACFELGICRSKAKFQEFLEEVLQTLLLSNETELQQSFDALIDSLKSADFSKALDANSLDIINDFLEEGDDARPLIIRAIYYTTLYALIHKDASISITSSVNKKVGERTVAFHDFIKIFDVSLSKDDKDLEWKQISQSIKDWKDGKRSDITDIMTSFALKMMKTMEKMDKKTLDKLNNVVKVLFDS